MEESKRDPVFAAADASLSSSHPNDDWSGLICSTAPELSYSRQNLSQDDSLPESPSAEVHLGKDGSDPDKDGSDPDDNEQSSSRSTASCSKFNFDSSKKDLLRKFPKFIQEKYEMRVGKDWYNWSPERRRREIRAFYIDSFNMPEELFEANQSGLIKLVLISQKTSEKLQLDKK